MRVPLTGLLLAAGLPLLASCGAVELAAPPSSAAKACAALADGVPASLLHHQAVEVSDADAGAAWGDPAITLECGVEMPADFTPGASCEEVNGVGWYVPTDQFADNRLDLTIYTIGRKPVVRLTIPSDYRADTAFTADALNTLSGPIKKHTKQLEPCV